MFFSGGFPGAAFGMDDDEMPGGFPGMGGRGGGRGMGGRGGPAAKKDVDTEKFYKLLGVEMNATGPEIKKAYRKMAIQHHPDKGGDPDKFKEISKAYETLSDDDKRRTYDQHGEEGLEQGGGGGGDPGDIFNMMFGGGRAGGGGRGGGAKQKGKTVTHNIECTLEQLYSGHTKKLAINRAVIDQAFGVTECNACDGRGSVTKVMRMGNMITQSQQPCNQCSGQGKSFKLKKEKEILEVYVERGAPDQHKVVFYGKADEQPGYEAGDVHFIVNEKPHKTFRRVKADLFVDRKITLLEALTGFTTEITHLDGRKLLVSTKPGEVIKPPPKSGEEDGDWEVFEGCDSPGEDHAKCQYQDPNKLKEVCIQKGFNGFVYDTNTKTAIFRQKSRSEWLSAKSKPGLKKNSHLTLYVVPDDAIAAVGRMKKAVKDEGMPQFKNSMLKGNLFINITIDFPASIKQDAAQQLKAILPGPSNVPIETDEHEIHYLEDMDPKSSEKANAHAYEEDDDDERAGGPGGGQGVQCAQQ